MINCFLTATSWGKDYDRRSMSGVPGLVMPCSECGEWFLEEGAWKNSLSPQQGEGREYCPKD